MKNKEWIVVIAVIIIVAIAVSLITVNLTGNVIKQNNNVFGQYQVYTKQEIDAKIKCATISPQEFTLQQGTSVTTADGKVLSIDFIGSTSVKIKVGGTLGVITTSLAEGETVGLSDKSFIGISDILVQDYAGGAKSVQITYYAAC